MSDVTDPKLNLTRSAGITNRTHGYDIVRNQEIVDWNRLNTSGYGVVVDPRISTELGEHFEGVCSGRQRGGH